MNDPETFERIGATGGLVAIGVGLSKLGVFKLMREWWKRPTERAMMRVAIEKLTTTQDRQCIALEGIGKNLTAMSDSLIIAEALPRFIADRDPMPMFQCEIPSGKCTWTNRALQSLFGRTQSEMLGAGWAEAIVPEFQERALHHWKNAIVNSDIYNDSYPLEVNGRLINVRSHVDFIRDSAGRKILAIGTVKPMPTLAAA